MKERYELLCQVMYEMYRTGNLPNLDMEDFMVMWKALMDHWGIKMSNDIWEMFIEDVNCLKSDDKEWFTKLFNQYFE